MAMLDNEPYLDQLSVRTRFMRAGIGSALLARVASKLRSAGHSTLWLTTYAHLGWNRPFYERVGFVVVPEGDSGPQLRQELAYQRRWLPCPDQRVVMRKELARDF